MAAGNLQLTNPLRRSHWLSNNLVISLQWFLAFTIQCKPGIGTVTAPLELAQQQVGGNASAAAEGDGGAIIQGRGVVSATVEGSEVFCAESHCLIMKH